MCSACLQSKVGFYSLTHTQIHTYIYIYIPMYIMRSDICQDVRENEYKPKKNFRKRPINVPWRPVNGNCPSG